MDVIDRVVAKIIKRNEDWLDFPKRYGEKRCELQRLRQEIYRLLPMSGNSAPPRRLETIATHFANIEIDGRSSITWIELPAYEDDQ